MPSYELCYFLHYWEYFRIRAIIGMLLFFAVVESIRICTNTVNFASCLYREYLGICAVVWAKYEYITIGNLIISVIIGNILGYLPFSGPQMCANIGDYDTFHHCWENTDMCQYIYSFMPFLGVFWRYAPLSNSVLPLSEQLMIYLFCTN